MQNRLLPFRIRRVLKGQRRFKIIKVIITKDIDFKITSSIKFSSALKIGVVIISEDILKF